MTIEDLRRLTASTLALSACFCIAPLAHAATSWGTKAEAYSMNCLPADCSGGASSGGDSQFPPAVVQYQGLPATNGVDGPLGTATVTASFDAPTPELATMRQTGEAVGGATGFAAADGHTLDFVTYSGPPVTVTIDVDLTGSFSGPLSGADSPIDGLRGDVFVFTDATAIAFIDGEQSPEPFCFFECYVPDDEARLTVEPGMTADSGQIVLNLEDGDSFYIYGRLSLAASGGGTASSLDTFTYSFTPSAGLSSLAGAAAGPSDSDGDGIADAADNCTDVANPLQQDSNGDGYGNACDGDLNDDGIVNSLDLGLFRSVFFTSDPHADMNSDGTVNASDLGLFRAGYFLPPGPSGIAP